jgi:hypothetical protein
MKTVIVGKGISSQPEICRSKPFPIQKKAPDGKNADGCLL